MTWLVIGASGQLGKSVCAVLNSLGIDFVGWNRQNGSASLKSYVFNNVAQMKPKVIVNCAAWTDVDGAETNESDARLINADAVGYLAEAAKKCGAILAHISTDYVFSGNRDIPWPENSSKQPLSAYGRTKAQGEDLINQMYSERSYIFRTAWLYSAYGKNFAKTMVSLALNESKELSVVVDQIGQPTFAGDLATRIVDSILAEIPFGIYHATNSGQTNWCDFAKKIYELVGADPNRVKPIQSSKYPQGALRPKYSVLGFGKWDETSLPHMRNWEVALRDNISEIRAAVFSN